MQAVAISNTYLLVILTQRLSGCICMPAQSYTKYRRYLYCNHIMCTAQVFFKESKSETNFVIMFVF